MTQIHDAIAIFFSHWIATLGVILTSTSALLFILLQFRADTNPYAVIVEFGAVPLFFMAGLIMIPLGIGIAARRAGSLRALIGETHDSGRRLSRVGFLVLAATGANLALLSTVSYQAVDYMESEAFCGTVCHVMEPQFVAYQDSPHARVGCVECHVGPGAASFLGAKLEGAGRLSAMVFGHDLPVRLADGNRVQLAATCTNCHAAEPDPESVSLRMIRSHANDEASTPRTTLLTIHASDIHSIHVGTDIRYIAGNADRSAIPWTAGGSRVFTAGETTAGDPEPMTCIDCHNRSGHEFESAGQAIDRAINEGRLARTLPFARRDAVAALTDDTAFPAGAAAIDAALERNVFPDQGVDWNTYPSHRGHADDLGCFRCHDGMHVDPSGETVSRNCLSCHAMVAVGQEEPAILRQLGVRP